MLKHAQSDFPPDIFFVDVLGVPPPKTRPCQMTGEIMTIHPQSTALERVIENIVVLKQIMQVCGNTNCCGNPKTGLAQFSNDSSKFFWETAKQIEVKFLYNSEKPIII